MLYTVDMRAKLKFKIMLITSRWVIISYLDTCYQKIYKNEHIHNIANCHYVKQTSTSKQTCVTQSGTFVCKMNTVIATYLAFLSTVNETLNV